MISTKPRFGFTTPPETFTLPERMESFEVTEARRQKILDAPPTYRCAAYTNPLTGLTGPTNRAANSTATVSERPPPQQVRQGSALPTEEPLMPKIDESRRDKYKAARDRGLDYMAAGKAAGYQWKNAKVGQICARKLDLSLGLADAPATARKPRRSPATVKTQRDPNRDRQRAACTDGSVSRVIEFLQAKRDELTNAIDALERYGRMAAP